MTSFSVGDPVIIRFGERQGLAGIVVKAQPSNVYLVRIEDGAVLFFMGKGLARKTEETEPVAC